MGEIKDENGRKERLYLFYDGESVTGKVANYTKLAIKAMSLNNWLFLGERDTASQNEPPRAPWNQDRIHWADRTLLRPRKPPWISLSCQRVGQVSSSAASHLTCMNFKMGCHVFFRPGELTQNTSFDFEFNQVEKPYECYTGANVRLRYNKLHFLDNNCNLT